MLSGRETRPDSPCRKGWYCFTVEMWVVMVWPALWKVWAYFGPGLPREQTRRGYIFFAALLAVGIEGGMASVEVVERV
jgi:hypothetical protein